MIHIKSFAKINLSLDVGGVMENGMHPVDMIMQQTTLHDDVIVDVKEGSEFSIVLKTDSDKIPHDSGNIAVRAAKRMIEEYKNRRSEEAERDTKKEIRIFIEKHIPVAAGLAGGSGNAAAVIHALNALWELDLSLAELCEIGKTLGSDVPFCVMGQAKENPNLPRKVRSDRLAVSCARARGTGTELEPVTALRAYLLIAKPDIEVSTAEVYRGIDNCKIEHRPDNDKLERIMTTGKTDLMKEEMINVLECYTLDAYPEVSAVKETLKEKLTDAVHILMSGSGPSIFAVFDDEGSAIEGFKLIKDLACEVYLCKAL